MATQFPQDPNAGRFIDGLRDQQANADEGNERQKTDPANARSLPGVVGNGDRSGDVF